MSTLSLHVLSLHDEAATLEAGRRLARMVRAGDLLALTGCLGAGKTMLVKGIVAGLGLDEPGVVTSPTFVLVNEYAARLDVYHLDAYRLSGPDGLEQLGFDEMCEDGGVVIVEWADRVAEAIPPSAIWIELAPRGDGREMTLRGSGRRARELADAISADPPP